MFTDPTGFSKGEPTVVGDEVCETLRRAAAEMRARGMAKGEFCSYEIGSVCAYGAIGLAMGLPVDSNWNPSKQFSYNPAAKALAAHIASIAPRFRNVGIKTRIVCFNDDDRTTESGMVELLESAAEARARQLMGA